MISARTLFSNHLVSPAAPPLLADITVGLLPVGTMLTGTVKHLVGKVDQGFRGRVVHTPALLPDGQFDLVAVIRIKKAQEQGLAPVPAAEGQCPGKGPALLRIAVVIHWRSVPVRFAADDLRSTRMVLLKCGCVLITHVDYLLNI